MRVQHAATSAPAAVSMRPWPYPYRAALAICSDLDETPTAADYFEMARFLNTNEQTRLGIGVNLEIGNSIYFDMPAAQFSYWNGDDAARARLRALIQSGYVDCLHSFGDLATTRRHAGRALDDLARHGCGLKVWIDHAVAPSNFGADIMQGSGDVVGSDVYHADLTLAFGIEYVWRGRVTSVIGQDAARRLSGIASPRHPVASALTVAREAAKGALARAHHAKYAPHAANDLLWPAALRSGQPVVEFLRSNPSWAGISVHDTADGLGEVINAGLLQRLVDRQAACVLYTHLGKMRLPGRTLAPNTRLALELVARARSDGDLMVTTTRRLLDFCRARRTASWTATADGDGVRIDISTAALPTIERRRLEGLTFYTDTASRVRLVVDGRDEHALRVNPPDHTGCPSVSIAWPRLSFPQL
jgi:hypothetical protein